jgi:hypothetical protein
VQDARKHHRLIQLCWDFAMKSNPAIAQQDVNRDEQISKHAKASQS